MPINITRKNDTLILEAIDYYQISDLIRLLQNNLKCYQSANSKKLIIDVRRSKEAPPNQALSHLARAIQALSSSLQGCAIVSADDLNYGLSRIIVSLADNSDLKIMPFRSFEQASHWLSSTKATSTNEIDNSTIIPQLDIDNVVNNQ